jgi:multiple sugar transport system ATP-binding protein
MVFQNYALYPHMSVYDNMAFSLMLAGESREQTRLRVEEAALILGLEDYLRRYPRQLSGGQRQRVAMGRAIVRKPQVFLFDEPLSNLDAKLRVAMRTEIRALHQRLKATSIYVTHDQVEAMTMADRMVVMNAGRIEQIGRPLDVYDHPATLYVAQFIGSPAINVWVGVVEASSSGPPILRTENGSLLALPDGGLTPGTRVAAAFRPEHAVINGVGPLEAQVSVVEPLGPETYVYLDIRGTRVCARVDRSRRLTPGERVRCDVAASALHLFDPQSGVRLTATP